MPTTPPASDGIPPVWFTVPDGFHPLPIAATAEERADLAGEFVRELLPNGDDTLWASTAPYYAGMGELMGSCGLAYSALGLFARDEGGIAHCAFHVGAWESGHPSVEAAANGVREVLVRDPANDVRWVDLPCGPAVSCMTLREFTLPAELAADSQESKLRAGQIQVHVPFPTGPYISVFTVDTVAMDYWGEFCDMTAAVLQTVSFSPPQE
ncbi:hypothetical protein AA958_18160 [Streptomyces sp. CNQ-509]|uniref:hypothetical protein n=1 Tax=Streptomyces sp. CNQ-509 TaxID=444103 RepID=UPI00062DE0FA|nr:hypothetical protein [Streptomyces sp. CNQ-509]AKH83813.1 hypothetical protein AA958_18160 [Streptomyces sp. CNQ-509]